MIPVRVGNPDSYVLREITEAQFQQHQGELTVVQEPSGIVMPGAGGSSTIPVIYFTGSVDEFNSVFGPSGVVGQPDPGLPPPPATPHPPAPEDKTLALLREIHEDVHKLAAVVTEGFNRRVFRQVGSLGPVDEPGE